MKRTRPHAQHDRWLVSYADFITLLFAFFVVLYASAQVDRHRMNQLAVAIQAGFQQMGVFNNANSEESLTVQTGSELKSSTPPVINARHSSAGIGDEFERTRLRLESELRLRKIPTEYVSVRKTADGVVVSLREVGFFDSGSARMRGQAAPIFARVASLVSEQHCQLRIEGHTDNVPIHNANFNSNWELSTARATEIIRLLVADYGFNPQDLSAAGYAEFHPLATNDTAEGRSANRRIDIVVLVQRSSSDATR
ncbi:MAG TPA: flagellar motor protein MotB [Terriglobales bacterium]